MKPEFLTICSRIQSQFKATSHIFPGNINFRNFLILELLRDRLLLDLRDFFYLIETALFFYSSSLTIVIIGEISSILCLALVPQESVTFFNVDFIGTAFPLFRYFSTLSGLLNSNPIDL